MKYGIDVCSYQGQIDWAKVKAAGCQFAVLKCIMRGLGLDSQFVANVAGCRENGIPISVYTYVYEGDVKGAQKRAQAAVKACQEQGLKGCTIWWDVEDASLRKVAPYRNKKNALMESIRAAQKIVEAAGFGFGVYCDMNFRTACLDDGETLKVKWWIARYGKNPVTVFGGKPEGAKPSIGGTLWGWQFCSRGRISGNVDLDVVYGGEQPGLAEDTNAPVKPPEENPYPAPAGTVTSTQQAAEKGLQKWIPKGAQVQAVQWKLQKLGYNLGAWGVDGVCGAATVAAIEAFQRDHGLTVDGLCGPKTWAALKNA